MKLYQNLDPVIRQLKSWHKYKTKPVKADTTILGNKTLLRYFRKFNNTTINENTDLLEYKLNESTVPCLPLSMILIAFNISHTQNIKGHSGSEKTYSNFIQNFYFPNAPIWIKILCNDCIVCQLNKPYPNQKQIAQKQDFKGQSLYFNHRISFDTKGPISPSSEGNSYIMVIVDAFTHYVALNPVPHCNAYYAYTRLYEHWIAKFGLPEILAWFIIDYFTHNLDLISQARKNFRPQNSNDDTAITEQSDYVWDPEWSHPAFINFPQSISSQAISTISYVRDYVRVIPLTIDATPLNYNTFLPDMQNNSLNSTIIHNENLNGTRNLTQQDIQTPSHFINEEIVQTTTTQQSISPIRPNLTTPRNTNSSQTQVTLQSTVKPSVAPKYSNMDYQTYRPMTIPSKTRKTFTRNNFAEHNYNYTHPSKTNYPPRKNFNNYTRSRNWDNPIAQTNSVNFQTNLHPSQDRSENYPFFQQNKNKKQTSYQMDYLSSDDDFLQPDIFAPYNQEYRGQGVQKPHINHRIFSPQPIDTQNQQPIQQQNPINTQYFQPIQQQNPMITHSYQPTQMQNEIPLPYYLQQHEITRNQLSNFSQMPNAAESLQMTMNPYLMGGSSITSNKPLMVFTGTDPEYSVEDYLNAVTANLILNIGPEPINTPLHQNWIHRRTALIQTTLDGAAQKWFSVLPLEIKSNWKSFT